MNLRQRLLKSLYPMVMKSSSKGENGRIIKNPSATVPLKSFYALKGVKGNGEELDFSVFKNKKVLIVNTASNCGYTGQYASLQELFEKEKDKLVILGFPSNEFQGQEKADDKAIAEFCQVNFGVTFPLMKKSIVLKQKDQNEVYNWLSNASQNGWNTQVPVWNFSKYLIDETGNLQGYFGPAVEPQDVLV